MNTSFVTFFKAGAVCFIILGLGHLSVHFSLSNRDPNPQIAALKAQMKAYKLEIFEKLSLFPGEHDLLSSFNGYSIMMGVLLLCFGIHNFALAQAMKRVEMNHPPLQLSAVFTSFLSLLLTLKFFFIIPQLFALLALIFFTISWYKYRSELKLTVSQ